ncbi:MAG TPA: PD-(D/E)XK nuclease superfamily protein [Polyangiaceae bacterium]|nr:PD-(D/E)XK nuclease superfamily protein [Polyangiaceae bacterium]
MALSGKEYADLVASYVLKNFGARGLTVYREVSMGKTIIGKNRHLDILVIHEATAAVLAIECKYQDTLGTVDEKIPYAIQDMEAMGVPVCLAYAGAGFSSGILHMLAACPIAAQCLPGPTLHPSRETRELDIALAMAFKFWDLVVAHKKPFVLAPEAPAPAPAPVANDTASDTLSVGPLFANSRSPDVES